MTEQSHSWVFEDIFDAEEGAIRGGDIHAFEEHQRVAIDSTKKQKQGCNSHQKSFNERHSTPNDVNEEYEKSQHVKYSDMF